MGKKHRPDDREEEEFSRNKRQQEASQEDLSEYIHACRPGVLAVIIALLVLLAAVIIWGFVGTLPVTETVTGLVVDRDTYVEKYPETENLLPEAEDGEMLILCFVDASRFNGQAIKEFGDKAGLKMPDQTTFTGMIGTRSQAPVSRERARDILFDNGWVLDKCVRQDYNWLLVIRPDEDISQYTFTLAEVTLLTDEVAPIRFLMR